MPKYRLKPQPPVDAFQLTVENYNRRKLWPVWAQVVAGKPSGRPSLPHIEYMDAWVIGKVLLSDGFLLSPEQFAAQYEPVEEIPISFEYINKIYVCEKCGNKMKLSFKAPVKS